MTEIQSEELEMLKKTIRFFEDNDINYFLCGGSLLGAIRHKGFIPWDDDIDIAISRNDYERVIEIGKNNPNIIDENLEIATFELNGLVKPFMKILNKKILVHDYIGIDKYLWIDIFPIDGLPKSQNKIKKLYKQEHFYKYIIALKESKISRKNNRLKYFIKMLLRGILKIVKTKTLINKMIKIAKKNKYSECDDIAVVVWGYGPQEKLKKNDIKPIKLEFEGIEVNGIEAYDKYLSNLYGEYMKLPPEEKRLTHHLKIERI